MRFRKSSTVNLVSAIITNLSIPVLESVGTAVYIVCQRVDQCAAF
jgi:hypothetical protein